jgi:hypothetical protein
MTTKLGRVLYCFLSGLILVSLLAIRPTGRASASKTIFVNAAAIGSHTGTSWGTAYTSLQQALDGAVSGDQIWVAKGTYKPSVVRAGTTGSRNRTFTLKDGVAIYGGFAGSETLLNQRNSALNVSVLSGDIGTIGSAGDNVYHVVWALSVTSTCILDGFTILGGNANAAYPDYWGAGLYLANSGPTLRNLVISGNSAGYAGGGVFNDHGAPSLTKVTFNKNHAGQLGGGMFSLVGNLTMNSLIFTGNTVGSTVDASGGGLYVSAGVASLINATFSANTAGGMGAFRSGGGLAVNGSTATLANVTFNGNKADTGGAVYIESSSPQLTNVTFSSNSALSSGGAIDNWGSSPRLTNVTFSNNSAGDAGGHMYNRSSSNAIIVNSIFAGSGDIADDATGAVAVSHSIVQAGCATAAALTCTNVRVTNPLLGPLQDNGGFANTMALGAGSPAIDAGLQAACPPRDERGVARPQGAGCDVGAYEVRAKKFVSQAPLDGWVLESSQNSGKGGTFNSTNPTLLVGDNAQNLRYRSILSFDTSGLPKTNITRVQAQIWLLRQTIIGNPIGTQGALRADMAVKFFGGQLGLSTSDFNGPSVVAGAIPSFSAVAGGWYRGTLASTARNGVNAFGTTQFRLEFPKDLYNSANDYFSFYSGNVITAANRPVLWVYYNP